MSTYTPEQWAAMQERSVDPFRSRESNAINRLTRTVSQGANMIVNGLIPSIFSSAVLAITKGSCIKDDAFIEFDQDITLNLNDTGDYAVPPAVISAGYKLLCVQYHFVETHPPNIAKIVYLNSKEELTEGFLVLKVVNLEETSPGVFEITQLLDVHPDDNTIKTQKSKGVPDVAEGGPGNTLVINETGDGVKWGTPEGVAPVENLALVAGSGQIELSWTHSDPYFEGIIVLRKEGTTMEDLDRPTNGLEYTQGDLINGDVTVAYIGTDNSFLDTGLTPDTDYVYRVWSFNALNTYAPQYAEATDTTLEGAPSVIGFALTAGYEQMGLSWSNPGSTFAGVLILAKEGGYPTSSPVSGINYTPGSSIGDATVIYSGNGVSFMHLNLDSGSRWYYTAVSYDSAYNYGGSAQGNRYVLVNAPTAFSASALTETTIQIDWTADLNTAGVIVLAKQNSAPTGIPTNGQTYVAGQTIGDATVIYAGTGDTYNHSGLAAGQNWYYTIYAHDPNRIYAGNASANSSTSVAAVQNFTATGVVQGINLTWNNPGGSFTGLIVLAKAGSAPTGTPVDGTTYTQGNTLGDATIIYVGSAESYNHTGLTSGALWYYKTFSYDAVHTYGGTATASERVKVDAPSSFVATSIDDTSIGLSWTLPANAAGVIVVAKLNSSPTGTPVDGTSYVVTNTIGDSEVIYVGNGSNTTHGSLNASEHWYYDIWAYDVNTEYSPSNAEADATSQQPSQQGFSDPNDWDITGAPDGFEFGSFKTKEGQRVVDTENGINDLSSYSAYPADVQNAWLVLNPSSFLNVSSAGITTNSGTVTGSNAFVFFRFADNLYYGASDNRLKYNQGYGREFKTFGFNYEYLKEFIVKFTAPASSAFTSFVILSEHNETSGFIVYGNDVSVPSDKRMKIFYQMGNAVNTPLVCEWATGQSYWFKLNTENRVFDYETQNYLTKQISVSYANQTSEPTDAQWNFVATGNRTDRESVFYLANFTQNGTYPAGINVSNFKVKSLYAPEEIFIKRKNASLSNVADIPMDGFYVTSKQGHDARMMYNLIGDGGSEWTLGRKDYIIYWPASFNRVHNLAYQAHASVGPDSLRRKICAYDNPGSIGWAYEIDALTVITPSRYDFVLNDTGKVQSRNDSTHDVSFGYYFPVQQLPDVEEMVWKFQRFGTENALCAGPYDIGGIHYRYVDSFEPGATNVGVCVGLNGATGSTPNTIYVHTPAGRTNTAVSSAITEERWFRITLSNVVQSGNHYVADVAVYSATGSTKPVSWGTAIYTESAVALPGNISTNLPSRVSIWEAHNMNEGASYRDFEWSNLELKYKTSPTTATFDPDSTTWYNKATVYPLCNTYGEIIMDEDAERPIKYDKDCMLTATRLNQTISSYASTGNVKIGIAIKISNQSKQALFVKTGKAAIEAIDLKAYNPVTNHGNISLALNTTTASELEYDTNRVSVGNDSLSSKAGYVLVDSENNISGFLDAIKSETRYIASYEDITKSKSTNKQISVIAGTLTNNVYATLQYIKENLVDDFTISGKLVINNAAFSTLNLLTVSANGSTHPTNPSVFRFGTNDIKALTTGTWWAKIEYTNTSLVPNTSYTASIAIWITNSATKPTDWGVADYTDTDVTIGDHTGLTRTFNPFSLPSGLVSPAENSIVFSNLEAYYPTAKGESEIIVQKDNSLDGRTITGFTVTEGATDTGNMKYRIIADGYEYIRGSKYLMDTANGINPFNASWDDRNGITRCGDYINFDSANQISNKANACTGLGGESMCYIRLNSYLPSELYLASIPEGETELLYNSRVNHNLVYDTRMKYYFDFSQSQSANISPVGSGYNGNTFFGGSMTFVGSAGAHGYSQGSIIILNSYSGEFSNSWYEAFSSQTAGYYWIRVALTKNIQAGFSYAGSGNQSHVAGYVISIWIKSASGFTPDANDTNWGTATVQTPLTVNSDIYSTFVNGYYRNIAFTGVDTANVIRISDVRVKGRLGFGYPLNSGDTWIRKDLISPQARLIEGDLEDHLWLTKAQVNALIGSFKTQTGHRNISAKVLMPGGVQSEIENITFTVA